MTPTQRRRAERWARTSLERLFVGWQGALISSTDTEVSADTRWRACEAGTAACQALQQGMTPHEVMLEYLAYLAPVFVVPGDEATK